MKIQGGMEITDPTSKLESNVEILEAPAASDPASKFESHAGVEEATKFPATSDPTFELESFVEIEEVTEVAVASDLTSKSESHIERQKAEGYEGVTQDSQPIQEEEVPSGEETEEEVPSGEETEEGVSSGEEIEDFESPSEAPWEAGDVSVESTDLNISLVIHMRRDNQWLRLHTFF